MRTSGMNTPSGRIRAVSPPKGRMAPRSRGPSNRPPSTPTTRRRPYGVWPSSLGGPPTISSRSRNSNPNGGFIEGSGNLAAPVDDNGLAGHERRLVAGQVQHGGGDVVGAADAADDDLLGQPLAALGVSQDPGRRGGLD